MDKNIAILGATDDPTRYAYKALKMLQAHRYNPIPVNTFRETIAGLKAYHSLPEIPDPVDTVTVYVRPEISSALTDDFLAIKPRRVIMNPDTENDELAEILERNGIEVVQACTLVMLQTGQF